MNKNDYPGGSGACKVGMASSHTDFSLSMWLLTNMPRGSNWRALAVHHKLTDITDIKALLVCC